MSQVVATESAPQLSRLASATTSGMMVSSDLPGGAWAVSKGYNQDATRGSVPFIGIMNGNRTRSSGKIFATDQHPVSADKVLESSEIYGQAVRETEVLLDLYRSERRQWCTTVDGNFSSVSSGASSNGAMLLDARFAEQQEETRRLLFKNAMARNQRAISDLALRKAVYVALMMGDGGEVPSLSPRRGKPPPLNLNPPKDATRRQKDSDAYASPTSSSPILAEHQTTVTDFDLRHTVPPSLSPVSPNYYYDAPHRGGPGTNTLLSQGSSNMAPTTGGRSHTLPFSADASLIGTDAVRSCLGASTLLCAKDTDAGDGVRRSSSSADYILPGSCECAGPSMCVPPLRQSTHSCAPNEPKRAASHLSAMQRDEEAHRALSLLASIRVLRRQTEDQTVLLLHACKEWECWARHGENHTTSLFSDLFPMQHLTTDDIERVRSRQPHRRKWSAPPLSARIAPKHVVGDTVLGQTDAAFWELYDTSFVRRVPPAPSVSIQLELFQTFQDVVRRDSPEKNANTAPGTSIGNVGVVASLRGPTVLDAVQLRFHHMLTSCKHAGAIFSSGQLQNTLNFPDGERDGNPVTFPAAAEVNPFSNSVHSPSTGSFKEPPTVRQGCTSVGTETFSTAKAETPAVGLKASDCVIALTPKLSPNDIVNSDGGAIPTPVNTTPTRSSPNIGDGKGTSLDRVLSHCCSSTMGAPTTCTNATSSYALGVDAGPQEKPPSVSPFTVEKPCWNSFLTEMRKHQSNTVPIRNGNAPEAPVCSVGDAVGAVGAESRADVQRALMEVRSVIQSVRQPGSAGAQSAITALDHPAIVTHTPSEDLPPLNVLQQLEVYLKLRCGELKEEESQTDGRSVPIIHRRGLSARDAASSEMHSRERKKDSRLVRSPAKRKNIFYRLLRCA